jgi:hypothetical protein
VSRLGGRADKFGSKRLPAAVELRAGVNAESTSTGQGVPVGELTPEQFTHLVLLAAAPPDRVGEVVARWRKYHHRPS